MNHLDRLRDLRIVCSERILSIIIYDQDCWPVYRRPDGTELTVEESIHFEMAYVNITLDSDDSYRIH